MENMKVKWLEQFLGNDWQITSAGGATGEAYIAVKNDKKLFLKRNSSPFLAVLSAEGIVPKLVWTRRMENGDVITAQKWLNGRELKPFDMKTKAVARMLGKIHRSTELLTMLKRIGKQPLLPEQIMSELHQQMDGEMKANQIIRQALAYLKLHVEEVLHDDKVVCHSDVNHNNWLLSEQDELYLIDWDGAVVADPALDLGLLLYWYIPSSDWDNWLQEYGITYTDDLGKRMKWYVISQTVLSIIWHRTRGRYEEAENWIQYLFKVLNNQIN